MCPIHWIFEVALGTFGRGGICFPHTNSVYTQRPTERRVESWRWIVEVVTIYIVMYDEKILKSVPDNYSSDDFSSSSMDPILESIMTAS